MRSTSERIPGYDLRKRERSLRYKKKTPLLHTYTEECDEYWNFRLSTSISPQIAPNVSSVSRGVCKEIRHLNFRSVTRSVTPVAPLSCD